MGGDVLDEVVAEGGQGDSDVDTRDLDLTPPWRRATMVELIAEHAGVKVDVAMPVDELRTIAAAQRVSVKPAWGPGKLVLEIYEKATESEMRLVMLLADAPNIRDVILFPTLRPES